MIEENQRAEVPDLGDKTSALHGPGGRMQPLVVDWFGRDVTPTLRANERNASYPSAEPLVIHPTIMARQNDGGGFNEAKSVAATGMIRRLTPMECEKLQAFPPGWTCLETEFDEDGVGRFAGGTPYLTAACKCPDGPRYKVLGNAITVNVGYWILDRIAKFEHGTLKPPPKP